jgi:LmbE family N-acetylglucosaminyl deacetylase
VRELFLFPVLLLTALSCFGQSPARPSSGELHAGIQKLGVLGSALYVAAHPDDENTRLIAYLANVDQVETAYLSLTRGDGGQNLIAPDISELLGLTRTQELLAARRIDGGKQFFSRANDFGYSKHPEETFTIWDREKVLADAVWVMRKWRPDVVILRFDPRAPGTTHGHHTASAIIGQEAFELAGDPAAFPEQLDYVEPWQPKRLYWNAYSWGDSKLPEYVDTTNIIRVDIGTYLPKRGESVAEIAARSRSQHKSQGFGSAGSRERYEEKLEWLAGNDRGEDGDPFAGIETGWSQLPGGAPIDEAIDRIATTFDFDRPYASVPALLRLRRRIQELPDAHWTRIKTQELDELIVGAMGLYLSATTGEAYAAAGDTLSIAVEASNRSPVSARLTGIRFMDQTRDTSGLLPNGHPFEDKLTYVIPAGSSSSPYWLQEDWSLGMYTVQEQQLRGKAESDDPIAIDFELLVDGEALTISRPLRHRYVDPVDGEMFQPFDILPAVFVETGESSYLFTTDEAAPINVKVSAGTQVQSGQLELELPEGWTARPARHTVPEMEKGQERFFTFFLKPPITQSRGHVTPVFRSARDEGMYFDRRLVTIDHPHIPTQRAALPARAAVARVELRTAGRQIGYLPGAGDAIPEALTAIGLNVTQLNDAEMSTGDLDRYDAIVIGVRAYNTLERMPVYQPRLLNYVKDGGTLIVQYNTNRRLRIGEEELGPYPLELSRDRVTVEEAPVRILAPDHPALNYPNKITAADFEGWVQERGLYFPNKWDERYTPLLSSHDPGEPDRDGGLLVAEYGDGHFVYTGYSFFRELPAGVPGAYRLFANLVALGQTK